MIKYWLKGNRKELKLYKKEKGKGEEVIRVWKKEKINFKELKKLTDGVMGSSKKTRIVGGIKI